MLSTNLRPRSLTEIVDAAFALLRDRYVPIITAGAVVLMPTILLQLLLPASLGPLIQFITNLLMTIFDAAVILIVSDAYLGRPADVGGTLRAVGARAGRLFGASIYRGILVVLGLFLLIVPGMIAFAWTFAMPMVIMLEDVDGASAAFTRSRALVRGDTGRVLGTLLLAFVVMILLTMVISMVLGLVLGAVGATGLAGVFGNVLLILVYPLPSVVATLLYYDLRIRKEGFDLEVMARELGLESAAVPAAPGAPAV